MNLTSTNANAHCFSTYNGSSNNIVNNIFANSGGGYAYYVYTPGAVETSNYNDLYTTGSLLGYWGAERATLNDLQTASGKDANSLSVNPGFLSNIDLHTFANALDSAGTPLTSVTDDIDSEIRDAMFPDIGADEFDSTGAVGIEEEHLSENNLPKDFKLYDNYPNPFNPSTTIRYDIPEAAHVLLEIFNILGQRVKILVDQNQAAGRYTHKFNGVDLSSGMYFFRIKAGQYHQVHKMILQR